ncbi:MAG: substrate-binding domain-containing protein [Planctomycetota bacterium]|nr:substrate-binding domain-containing protein [Planctomycetota bacterium]
MPRPDHLYRKMLDELRRQVTGSFAGGETLPSQRVLAYMHGAGQATIHRALTQLAKEGLVEARPRLGWVRVGERPTARSRLKSIGIVTRRNQREVASKGNPLYAGLADEAARRGFATAFHTNPKQHHPTPGRNRVELSRVAWNSFDVALLVELEDAVTLADPLLRAHPVLSVDLDATVYGHSSVTFDDVAAGRLAARHFFELGHRRFSVVDEVNQAGWPAEATWMVRRQAFEAEVGRLGGAIHPLWRIPNGRHGRNEGQAAAAVKRWMDFPAAQRPTALFAVDLGPVPAVIQELEARGLRVPRDLSIMTVQWNDSVAAPAPNRRFTRVELDPHDLVRRALDAAEDVLARSAKAAPVPEAKLYTAPVVLAEGVTTAPAPS